MYARISPSQALSDSINSQIFDLNVEMKYYVCINITAATKTELISQSWTRRMEELVEAAELY